MPVGPERRHRSKLRLILEVVPVESLEFSGTVRNHNVLPVIVK
jgi:hypothetical protein